jgi:hypothetical protein
MSCGVLCGLVKSYHCFGGTCCLRLQDYAEYIYVHIDQHENARAPITVERRSGLRTWWVEVPPSMEPTACILWQVTYFAWNWKEIFSETSVATYKTARCHDNLLTARSLTGRCWTCSASCLRLSGFLLGFLLHPKNGVKFFRNVWFFPNLTTLQPRKHYLSQFVTYS